MKPQTFLGDWKGRDNQDNQDGQGGRADQEEESQNIPRANPKDEAK